MGSSIDAGGEEISAVPTSFVFWEIATVSEGERNDNVMSSETESWSNVNIIPKRALACFYFILSYWTP